MFRKSLVLLLSMALLAVSSYGQTAKEVVLQKAGTLSSLISEEEFLTVTDLKVRGPINGADLRLIRHMAGATDLSNTSGKVGVLKNLVLREARVVTNTKEFYCIEDLSKTGFEYSVLDIDFYRNRQLRVKNDMTPIRFDKEVKKSDWDLLVKASKKAGIVHCESFEKKKDVYLIKCHTEDNFIGIMTFYDCKTLETVVLPQSTEIVERRAFLKSPKLWVIESSNSKLLHREISENPQNMRIYENSAYFQVTQEEATLDVKEPGALLHALRRFNPEKLTSLKISGKIDGNDIYALREWCGKNIGVDMTKEQIDNVIEHYPNSYSLKSIDMSEASIVETGESAVYWAKALKLLTRNEIDIIRKNAVEAGGSRQKMPNTNQSVMFFYSKDNLVGPFMFEECYLLKRIVLPKNTQKIYDYAFQRCHNLTEIVLPEGFDKKNLSGSIFDDYKKDELAGNVVHPKIPSSNGSNEVAIASPPKKTVRKSNGAGSGNGTGSGMVEEAPPPPPLNAMKETVYDTVEAKPTFPYDNLNAWLAQTMVYPVEAAKEGIEGRVIVQFVVGKDGTVRDATVVRSVDPLLDAEALRVVNAMPRWNPGIQNGEPIDCKMTMPIIFRLQ